MKRISKAHWSGSLKEGKGSLTTQSGFLNDIAYTFKTRFEDDQNGTNPDELLAAAHAGCFTMWVASLLTQRGLTQISLDTQATVTLEGMEIVGIKLSITGTVPGISSSDFEAITKDAEVNCIISKALKVPITSVAHLIA